MLTAKLILERLDKEGRLLERTEQLSRSFTKGFLQLLYVAHAQIQSAAPYTMNDITNTARTIDSQSASANAHCTKANLKIGATSGLSGDFCHAGAFATAYPFRLTIKGEEIGIQVGIGTTAVTPTDYAMETRIVHGTSAGTFQYGGCELIDIVFANPNGEFTIRRYFTNASGGSITVNEAGIYSVGVDYDDSYAWAFLIAHDIVSPGVAVADGELLKVTYVPQITV